MSCTRFQYYFKCRKNDCAILCALESAYTQPANQIILSSEAEFRIQYDFFANGVGSVFDSFDYTLHGRAPNGFGGLHDDGNGVLQKIKPSGVIKGYNLDVVGYIYSNSLDLQYGLVSAIVLAAYETVEPGIVREKIFQIPHDSAGVIGLLQTQCFIVNIRDPKGLPISLQAGSLGKDSDIMTPRRFVPLHLKLRANRFGV